jgi:hypothetical protein
VAGSVLPRGRTVDLSMSPGQIRLLAAGIPTNKPCNDDDQTDGCARIGQHGQPGGGEHQCDRHNGTHRAEANQKKDRISANHRFLLGTCALVSPETGVPMTHRPRMTNTSCIRPAQILSKYRQGRPPARRTASRANATKWRVLIAATIATNLAPIRQSLAEFHEGPRREFDSDHRPAKPADACGDPHCQRAPECHAYRAR